MEQEKDFVLDEDLLNLMVQMKSMWQNYLTLQQNCKILHVENELFKEKLKVLEINSLDGASQLKIYSNNMQSTLDMLNKKKTVDEYKTELKQMFVKIASLKEELNQLHKSHQSQIKNLNDVHTNQINSMNVELNKKIEVLTINKELTAAEYSLQLDQICIKNELKLSEETNKFATISKNFEKIISEKEELNNQLKLKVEGNILILSKYKEEITSLKNELNELKVKSESNLNSMKYKSSKVITGDIVTSSTFSSLSNKPIKLPTIKKRKLYNPQN